MDGWIIYETGWMDCIGRWKPRKDSKAIDRLTLAPLHSVIHFTHYSLLIVRRLYDAVMNIHWSWLHKAPYSTKRPLTAPSSSTIMLFIRWIESSLRHFSYPPEQPWWTSFPMLVTPRRGQLANPAAISSCKATRDILSGHKPYWLKNFCRLGYYPPYLALSSPHTRFQPREF